MTSIYKKPPSGIVASAQQKAVYRWVANKPSKTPRKKHLIIRARAGCGKTTTAVEALSYSMAERIYFMAFNKPIVAEMKRRVHNPTIQISTIHSMGRRLATAAWGPIRVLEGKERERTLTSKVVPGHMHPGVQNTVSYLHTKAREILPLATGPDELIELMWRFDIHVPEWAEDDWEDADLARYAYDAMQLAADRKWVMAHGMDFSDMIFLPVKCRLMADLCDEIYVDEAQDMSEAQLAMAQGVCPNGRIILIGDDRQAIYGWRGAATNGIQMMKERLDADELPLTVTYRCGKAIVDLAKRFVPDFEAHPTAPDGEVRSTTLDKMMSEVTAGDFILARARAPLTKIAMNLLKDGKRARIAGKDLNKGLIRIIDKLCPMSTLILEFTTRLEAWKMDKIERYAGDEANTEKAQMVMDQADILFEISEIVTDTDQLKLKLDDLFADDGSGEDVIMCSTVHKAKGFERKRVYLLQETFQPGRSQEEDNITYVAITRAKTQLVWVRR